jgi:hypothetical protein
MNVSKLDGDIIVRLTKDEVDDLRKELNEAIAIKRDTGIEIYMPDKLFAILAKVFSAYDR